MLRVIKTTELDEDATSEPVMVLDETHQTAVENIPALPTFQSCDDFARKPMMEKAEAEVPRKATQTAVVETADKIPFMTGVADADLPLYSVSRKS